MKLPFPRRFKAWLVATVSLTAVALVSVAPMMRTRAQGPPTYTITDLGSTLGGTESKAFAINSCGQIAGYATLAGESKRPFFRPSSSLINLGVLSGDGIATSLNNSGQVVGYSPTNGSTNRAFIWHDDNGNNQSDPGEMKELLPNGRVGSAEDVNDNGRVVGWVQSDGDSGGTGGYEGFTWDANQNPNFQIISGSPAHASTLAHGINNAGAIVGEDSDQLRGFILRNGIFTDIPVFAGGSRSVAYAVSEADHVVGAAAVDANASPTLHAFIWTDAGGLKDLGTLTGKTRSTAYNIAIVSSSVQVVGTSYSTVDLSDARAFVWQDLNLDGDGNGAEDAGEMKYLWDLIPTADQGNWTSLQHARSINSSGQIVGFGLKTNGETHAFLLTPTGGSPSPCLPNVNVSVSPSAMNEDAVGSLTYTFTRSITTGSPLTVSFSTTGTANSSDYSISPSGTVTIPANQQSATVVVDPATDADVEPNETVILTTTAGPGYNVGTPTSATGTINNDDSIPTVSVAVSPLTAAEDGTPNLVYTFTRSTVTGSPVIVSFATTGTAVASDYAISAAGTVTIPGGLPSATVTVDPTVDTTDEPDETVILTITPDVGAYTIAAPPLHAATGTITDDDGTPTISITPVTAAEPTSGSTNFVFTVSLTNPSSTQINVNYATASAGASPPATGGAGCTAGIDYVDTAGTLQFSPGETSKQVSVTVCSDNSLEPDEIFFVNLSGNSANSVLPANTKGTGTITPQAPTVFTEEGNVTFAAAVDSVIFARGPFRLTNDLNFSSDRSTRVILFTSTLGMTDADLATGILTVNVAGYATPLPIEHVGPFTFPFSPGFPAVNGSYIIVRLPADLPNPSPGPNNLTLTVKMGSATSNATILSITP